MISFDCTTGMLRVAMQRKPSQIITKLMFWKKKWKVNSCECKCCMAAHILWVRKSSNICCNNLCVATYVEKIMLDRQEQYMLKNCVRYTKTYVATYFEVNWYLKKNKTILVVMWPSYPWTNRLNMYLHPIKIIGCNPKWCTFSHPGFRSIQ